MKILPIILAGGSGSRLWPLSRENYPKQYLNLVGNLTIFQETIKRIQELAEIENPIIICNENHRFIVADQCQQINIHNPTIILEPIGRNTAPAITSAALHAENFPEDTLLLVLSSDHYIDDKNKFIEAINIAIDPALKGKMVTFGISPTSPNTGYGYIKIKEKSHNGAFIVENFVEKPDQKLAESYIRDESYFWNSGIFLFRRDTFLTEIEKYSPLVLEAVKKSVHKSIKDLDFIRLGVEDFESSQSISVDCAVMEKSDNLILIPLDTYWSDLGTWKSLYEISEKDDNGNVVSGDVIPYESRNCYIRADHHILATIGVEDLIIVDTSDATIVASKDKAHEVGKIFNEIKSNKRYESSNHRKVHRPWGWFDTIETGSNFQVKRLNVKAGAKLSLQMHNHRAEHWVVVSGIAIVTNGEEVLTLHEGESTFIPTGVVHSLENQTKSLLEIIEIQSGSYLGEDDIIRFEDIYGRV